MMSDIVQIGFKVNTAEVEKGYKRLDKMGQVAEKTEKKIESSTKKSSDGFAMLKRNIAAAAAALAAYVTAGKLIGVSREFDILNASLVTATKSTENAAIAFQAIEKFAATTPYNLAQSVDGFVKLVNLGLTPSERALKSYGNTAAALGNDLSQMVEAVADATTGEFERLKEFGIKSSSEGDRVSFTFQGMTKTIGKNAAEIEEYLIALGENEFAGAMENRAKTLDGAISNLGDSWDGLYRTISNAGVSKLMSDAISSVTIAIDTASSYISSGALSAYTDAFYQQWKFAIDGVVDLFDFLSDIWLSVIETASSGYQFFIGKIPAYTKNAIQRVAIEISSIVDAMDVYGSAFVEVFKLKANEIADRARILGKDIANAVNPFADQYDASADIEAMQSMYAGFYASIKSDADSAYAAIKQGRIDSISDIDKEKSASLESFDAQIKAADELLAKYNEIKATPQTGDLLAGFKIGGNGNEYDAWLKSISTTSTKLKALREEIEKAKSAMKGGFLDSKIGGEYIKDLESQIKSLEVNPFESMTQGASDALSAMSGMFESGSKDAKKLAIAMEALNLVQAVGAVLNQGNGDPYTAFGRMAAMATMVASLGMSIGGLSGGLSDDSADNQANQNLNSWGEHSESIADSTELVANATEKLVGINTNMLEALQGLNLSITAAAGIASKNINAPNVSVNVKDNIFDGLQNLFSGDVLNLTGLLGDTFVELLNAPLNFLGSWLGGSSKVTDEGIRIMGGYINDLVDDITIDSFQSVKYKKWRFGSSKNKTVYENVGDDVEAQFSLVFDSIINSVAVGAEMLGMTQGQIESAINQFEVATQNLSLKDLDVDERVEVINNYFSSVFNNLAVSVIPFLEKFQQAGEELGTTLTRLATEVSVAEYLVDNFGVQFGDKMANPEAFAQAATNLAALAGGVEELAEQTSSFTNAFATDAQKFDIYSNAMNEALNSVGLTLPSTAEGLFNLMSTLDGTTESGQEQIATLLGLTDTATAYYKLLEDTAGAYREAAEGLYAITEASRNMSLESALAAARLGDFSLAEELDLSSIAPSTSDFATQLDYNLARAETAARLNELADLQGGKVTVEDKQLTVLEQIRDKLGDGDTMSNQSLVNEVSALKVQMNKQQSETNDYLRRMAYQGA
ncbi:tail tape measure protein [Vibrio phage 2E1]|nr:tail tape measure protein [Vibrio phage 2E1]